jgi:DNA-binding SARP family transcriptional activator
MVDFRVLGPLEVRANGDRLRLGGRKQRALLAVLLLNANEVVSRDRLIDVLWGGRPPPTASHTLDAYVSRLRKALACDGDGEVRLVTVAPGYVLRIAPEQLDLARFARLAADGQRALDAGEPELAAAKLRQAEALWRGQPLADLEFEPFVHATSSSSSCWASVTSNSAWRLNSRWGVTSCWFQNSRHSSPGTRCVSGCAGS